jgi:hypothetical protein
MATVIDALVVTLGLDRSAFEKGRKEAEQDLAKTRDAVEKTGGSLDKMGKSGGEALEGLARRALSFFAILAGAKSIEDFTKQIVESDSALGRLAKSLGVAPDRLSALSNAVERNGGSAENASNSFRGLNDSFQELKETGNTGILVMLQRLQGLTGVPIDIRNGFDRALPGISQALELMAKRDGQARADWYARQLGIDPETARWLEQGWAKVKADIEESRRLGVVSPESAKAAQELLTSFRALSQEIQNAGRLILVKLAPAMKDGIKLVRDTMLGTESEIADDWRAMFAHMWKVADKFFKDFAKMVIETLVLWLPKQLNFVYRLVTGKDMPGYDKLKELIDGGIDKAFERFGIGSGEGSGSGGAGGGRGNKRGDVEYDRSGQGIGSDRRLPGAGGTGLRGAAHGRPNELRGGGQNPPPAAGAAGPPGTYRPIYHLSDADLSDAVVNTIVAEARHTQESTDAVINNMMNRIGTRAYGPSQNLKQVARSPKQYEGYKVASPQQAEFIRSRIRAIASGGVPDNTFGSNEYRGSYYRGRWYRRHMDAPVVGGNRFAFNPAGGRGDYYPYDNPRTAPSAPAPSASSPKTIVPHPKAGTEPPVWHYPTAPGSPFLPKKPSVLNGIPNAANVYGNLSGAISAFRGNNSTSNTHHNTEISVGSVHIKTDAKDPEGIAKTIGPAIQRHSFATHANYGPA